MLTEEEICQALHASRVVPLAVANPHGPLGLEQLAAAVAAHREHTQSQPSTDRVRRPIELPVQTWEKLQALAATASEAGAPPVSAGELAATIIERYVHDAASS
ncbi:MAG TPA: hypothetical protein VMF69_01335 [Gemmataceae bacterium]|nr:hypothetical protein [Gemmataceae bacterium]